MKTIPICLFLLLAVRLCAGGPGAEIREALIEAVEETPAGWVATVTGVVNFPLADPTDASRGQTVKLMAHKAKLQVPFGNHLYLLSVSGAPRYAQRMKESVGRRIHIQIWGPTVVITGGRVTEITAGDISFLRPTREEAEFDLSRLSEISVR